MNILEGLDTSLELDYVIALPADRAFAVSQELMGKGVPFDSIKMADSEEIAAANRPADKQTDGGSQCRLRPRIRFMPNAIKLGTYNGGQYNVVMRRRATPDARETIWISMAANGSAASSHHSVAAADRPAAVKKKKSAETGQRRQRLSSKRVTEMMAVTTRTVFDNGRVTLRNCQCSSPDCEEYRSALIDYFDSCNNGGRPDCCMYKDIVEKLMFAGHEQADRLMFASHEKADRELKLTKSMADNNVNDLWSMNDRALAAGLYDNCTGLTNRDSNVAASDVDPAISPAEEFDDYAMTHLLAADQGSRGRPDADVAVDAARRHDQFGPKHVVPLAFDGAATSRNAGPVVATNKNVRPAVVAVTNKNVGSRAASPSVYSLDYPPPRSVFSNTDQTSVAVSRTSRASVAASRASSRRQAKRPSIFKGLFGKSNKPNKKKNPTDTLDASNLSEKSTRPTKRPVGLARKRRVIDKPNKPPETLIGFKKPNQ